MELTMTNKDSDVRPLIRRADNWVENLSVDEIVRDPLNELVAALSHQAQRFGVRRARVLIGETVDPSAEANLRDKIAGRVEITGIDSFDLAHDGTRTFPDASAWQQVDAILCLDPGHASYLNAVQFCFDNGLTLPVLTDFAALPAQSCQIGFRASHAPEDSDIFIYNYFERNYRIKDPLQIVWRAYWSTDETTHGTFFLGPNESVRLRPHDLGQPDGAADGTLVYEAGHPAFARVPNTRFRGLVDIYGRHYCASLHGDEIQPKRVAEGRWFDTHVGDLGGNADVVLTLRNDVSDPGELEVALTLQPIDGGSAKTAVVTLSSHEMQKSVPLAALAAAPTQPTRHDIVAEVTGRACRLEWAETATDADDTRGFFSNHGSTNSFDMRDLVGARSATTPPDSRMFEKLRELAEHDVLALPYPMPVLPDESDLQFSFSAGKFLPRIDSVTIVAFDNEGRMLGRDQMALPKDLGYVTAGDTPFADALAAGGLLLISPPYVENDLVAYQNCREDLWLRLASRSSGEGDIAEFQMHNRNLRGYTLPIGFGQSPQMIKSRTDMMIRFRCEPRFETRLLLINASPELGFDRHGPVTLEFNQPDGSTITNTIEMAPQTCVFAPVAELAPAGASLPEHGWVRVVSNKLALSAYCALIDRPGGGIGFQHLWGA
jgi:hypothetical protein